MSQDTYGVKVGQLWRRVSDGALMEVMYTIVPEVRVRYLASGRTPYIVLARFVAGYEQA
jgi:hypothetical protein